MRTSLTVLALSAALGVLPRTAKAATTGSFTVRGSGTRSTSELPGGTLRSSNASLEELLLLRSVGYPMGESLALVSGGLSLSRSDAFGALRSGNQGIGWDLSSGLLPLRGFPLTVYGSGSNNWGLGVSEVVNRQLAYGARMNLRAQGMLPALRASVEQRTADSEFGPSRFHELRRTYSAGFSKLLGTSSLDGELRREVVQLDGSGDYLRHFANFTHTGPDHRTTLNGQTLASRTLELGARSDSQLALLHSRRWTEAVRSEHGASGTYIESRGSRASRVGATSALSLKPFTLHDFTTTVDASGSRSELTAGSRTSGSLLGGAGLQLGYGYPIGRDRLSLTGQTRYDYTTGEVDLSGGRIGVGATAGATLGRFDRFRGGVSYGISQIFASDRRGGEYTEQTVGGNAFVDPARGLSLSASANYTDRVRELVDLQTQSASPTRDRQLTLGARANRQLRRAALSLDAGYQRGLMIVESGGFALENFGVVTTLSGGIGLSAPILTTLTTSARVGLTETDSNTRDALIAAVASANLRYRVGLFSFDLDYAWTSSRGYGADTAQHTVTGGITRTFDGF